MKANIRHSRTHLILLVLCGLLPVISLAQPPAHDDCSAATVVGTGIFAGDTTGGLSGRIIDAATDFPLAGVLVGVRNESGDLRASGLTDIFGTYRVDGLIPAVHYVTTSNRDGYIDEQFDDLTCPFSYCPGILGTAVAVEAGAVTRNVTFRLDRGGSVSGRVTAESTGEPIPNRVVDVSDERGLIVASDRTGEAGTYSVDGLPAGLYSAHVSGTGGLVGELYDGVLCPFGPCDRTFGTPVPVELGAETGGIDFSLVEGGSVSGRVTDAATGEPISAEVQIFDVTGRLAGWRYTDSGGSYTIGGFLSGTYYAKVRSASDYLGELYGGFTCPFGCTVTAGTPFVVDLGSRTAGIDFALTRGGGVSGTVATTEGGEPPEDAVVLISDLSGTVLAVESTDREGRYRAGPLPAGTYLAWTEARGGFLGELYDAAPCFSGDCDLTFGTPITVELGADTAGIDFVMAKGSAISGTVTDEATGEPVTGVRAHVLDEAGDILETGSTDPQGRYEVGGLAPGDYFVRMFDSAGFSGELHDGVPCPFHDCDLANGTPVTVELGGETGGIDFALTRGGSLSGTVAAETGEALSDILVTVFAGNGFRAGSVVTGAAGDYRVDGLATGSYFARTAGGDEFLDTLYGGLPCPRGCDPTDGTPIAVEAGVETGDIDFALALGGTVSGTLTDAAGGAPVGGGLVRIVDRDTSFSTSIFASADGTYSFDGLRAGTYSVYTVNVGHFVGQLFDDLLCPLGNCDLDSGTPVTVELAVETDGVDFVLDRGGRLSGAVTAVTGQGLTRVRVDLFDAAGSLLDFTQTRNLGRFRFIGLPSGSFFVRAGNAASFMGELYDDVPCPFGGCETTYGTGVGVSLGLETTGVDFGLTPGGSLAGTLTDAASGQVIRRIVRVEIFDSAGAMVTFVNSQGDGNYRADGLGAGTYFVRAGASGFSSQLYAGVACPDECDVTAGTPVTVELDGVTDGIDFALSREP